MEEEQASQNKNPDYQSQMRKDVQPPCNQDYKAKYTNSNYQC